MFIKDNFLLIIWVNLSINFVLPKRTFRKVRPSKQRKVGPRTELVTGASESIPVTKSMSSTFLLQKKKRKKTFFKRYLIIAYIYVICLTCKLIVIFR